MLAINATKARNEWSAVVDSVIRQKPRFIKRTRDYMILANVETFADVLSAYTFSAEEFIEDDGSVTLALNEIDLAENGKDKQDAVLKLAKGILEYAEDYYHDFSYWSSAPNRKPHIPYVLKALIIGDAKKLGEFITCQAGGN